MGKKSKASPSQLAMSEVLQREFKDDIAQASAEVVEKPAEKAPVATVARKRARGAKYAAAQKAMGDKKTLYSLAEAIERVQKATFTKFPETLEMHINVSEMGLKGEVSLPYATGKKVVVAVADDALVDQLEKGVITFDILVSSPAMMPKLTKFAKLLGPRGLMPNPKAGTLGPNVEELAKKFAGNVVRYKTEGKAPVIHVIIGKTANDTKELTANAESFLSAIGQKNIKSVFIASTMTPSVRVQV